MIRTMRYLLCFIPILALGCASAQPLPALGEVLAKTRAVYEKLDAAHAAVCHEPIPETVEACVVSDKALTEVNERYNEVLEIYTEINESAVTE